MIRCMVHVRGRRERLGQLVARRRHELQLSAAAAARAARVSRGTWIALEAGTRDTEAYNYAGIERALAWGHGSVEAVLDGREPTVLAEAETTNPRSARPETADEREIRRIRDANLTPEVKDRIIAAVLERQERDRRERAELARLMAQAAGEQL